MASEAQTPEMDNTALFLDLDSYPWDEDQEFQVGLQAILGSFHDPEQVDHLTLRAKCYYYARKAGTPVDFDAYRRWVEQQRERGYSTISSNNVNHNAKSDAPAQTDGPSSGGAMGDAPKPASFAEIVEMISEGKPIPGIKEIPDTILEGQASKNHAEKRKKPWEKDGAAAESPSWMT